MKWNFPICRSNFIAGSFYEALLHNMKRAYFSDVHYIFYGMKSRFIIHAPQGALHLKKDLQQQVLFHGGGEGS